MIAIETTEFQKDIDEIDQFLFGRINQDTWQTEPIELDGKIYIKYKPILAGLKSYSTTEITIPTDDE